jgi:hypothetical protein
MHSLLALDRFLQGQTSPPSSLGMPCLDSAGRLTIDTVAELLDAAGDERFFAKAAKFRQEFLRLRGYDPFLYLPVLAGRVVESLEISERFLWDVRMTVNDLLVQNYAGRFRELARQCFPVHIKMQGILSSITRNNCFSAYFNRTSASKFQLFKNNSYFCIHHNGRVKTNYDRRYYHGKQ